MGSQRVGHDWVTHTFIVNCGMSLTFVFKLVINWAYFFKTLCDPMDCSPPGSSTTFIYLLFLIFIYLRAAGLSCSMWDLVPWPGIEPGTPALGTQNLSHWITRGVSELFLFVYELFTTAFLPTSEMERPLLKGYCVWALQIHMDLNVFTVDVFIFFYLYCFWHVYFFFPASVIE